MELFNIIMADLEKTQGDNKDFILIYDFNLKKIVSQPQTPIMNFGLVLTNSPEKIQDIHVKQANLTKAKTMMYKVKSLEEGVQIIKEIFKKLMPSGMSDTSGLANDMMDEDLDMKQQIYLCVNTDFSSPDRDKFL